MRPELKDLLLAEAEKFSARLSENELAMFASYLALIRSCSEKLNLTGIGDEDGIVVKHFIDSLAGHEFLDENRLVLDIGSGMGCPGIALKIARPSLKMILLESNHKKAAFINQVIRSLGLQNARGVARRAEDKDFQAGLSGQVDAVLSRAAVRLDLLLELAAPYLKKGGRLLAYKGREAEKEMADSLPALKQNGFANEDIFRYELPFGSGSHVLLVLSKV